MVALNRECLTANAYVLVLVSRLTVKDRSCSREDRVCIEGMESKREDIFIRLAGLGVTVLVHGIAGQVHYVRADGNRVLAAKHLRSKGDLVFVATERGDTAARNLTARCDYPDVINGEAATDPRVEINGFVERDRDRIQRADPEIHGHIVHPGGRLRTGQVQCDRQFKRIFTFLDAIETAGSNTVCPLDELPRKEVVRERVTACTARLAEQIALPVDVDSVARLVGENIDGGRGDVRQIIVGVNAAVAAGLQVNRQRRQGCAIQQQSWLEQLQDRPARYWVSSARPHPRLHA